MNIYTLLILMFLIIMISLIMNFKHMLMTLLYLESMMLTLVLLIPSIMNMSSPSHQLSLMLLSFSACEASLGLSLIVMLSRRNGSDLLSLSSINKC